MKLLMVTCVQEYKAAVTRVFAEAGIRIFSITETVGVKSERDENLLDDWFGSKDGEYRSLILFSFAVEESVLEAMRRINLFNEKEAGGFPVRAFVMSVEASNL